MKNKMTWLYVGLAVLLIITGVVVYKAIAGPAPTAVVEDIEDTISLPEADAAIQATLGKAAKANTVVLKVTGLEGKYVSIGYEFSYESKGLIKGVNSGSKPIDVTGQSTFDREVYLGTCSKNDCTPDVGVTKLSVVLQFTDKEGKQTQLSKEFDL
jgi:hypothetical protein